MSPHDSSDSEKVAGGYGRNAPKHCPCVDHPFDECYCNTMSSIKSEKAIQYCGGDYENCQVYMKYKKENPKLFALHSGTPSEAQG